MIDVRLGIVTWLVAVAHEIPQELGDFGILVHSGWKPRSALAYNVASAVTFLVGALVVLPISGAFEVAYLVAFAAGNFLYIAAADLIPTDQFARLLCERARAPCDAAGPTCAIVGVPGRPRALARDGSRYLARTLDLGLPRLPCDVAHFGRHAA